MRTLLLALLCLGMARLCLSGSCHPSCGSQTALGCSDFATGNNNPEKCFTCAFGYVGGGGDGVKTAKCTAGSCNAACKSCLDSTTATNCYVCTGGYFDPVANPAIATPCNKCDDSCWTCTGAAATQCLTCARGWFDALENPYTPSACTKCAAQCKTCRGAEDKCTACSADKHYSTDELFGGSCLPVPEISAKLAFTLAAFAIFLIMLI